MNNNIDDDDDEDKRVKIELTDTASISGLSVLGFEGAEVILNVLYSCHNNPGLVYQSRALRSLCLLGAILAQKLNSFICKKKF
jgi:hypothetical protein